MELQIVTYPSDEICELINYICIRGAVVSLMKFKFFSKTLISHGAYR